MQYVKTFKTKLVDGKYDWSSLNSDNLFNLRDFHQQYPAPLTFIIPNNILTIGDKQLQILALWYLQGTTLLYHKDFSDTGNVLTLHCKDAKPRWAYKFVNELPKHYLTAKKTTTEAAYNYGQTLINAVNKANKIPYSTLEDAYKVITRSVLKQAPRMRIYSPNAKTLIEVRAELQAAKEINQLTSVDDSDEAELLANLYTPEEINLYCRIFAIEMPQWSLRYRMVITKHGYAQCPELVMEPSNSSMRNSDYDGADSDFQEQLNRIPYTLRRDSLPTKIAQRKLTIEIAQQISWYLNTFKATRDSELLSPDWGYCEICGFYQKTEGCQCGAILSLAELELRDIEKTCEAIQNGTFDITTIEEV